MEKKIKLKKQNKKIIKSQDKWQWGTYLQNYFNTKLKYEYKIYS